MKFGIKWLRNTERKQPTYYSKLFLERQYNIGDEIITDIERYRSLIDLLVLNQDDELVKEKADEFNNYLKKFKHFYRDDENYDVEEDLPLQNSPNLENELKQGQPIIRDSTVSTPSS